MGRTSGDSAHAALAHRLEGNTVTTLVGSSAHAGSTVVRDALLVVETVIIFILVVHIVKYVHDAIERRTILQERVSDCKANC